MSSNLGHERLDYTEGFSEFDSLGLVALEGAQAAEPQQFETAAVIDLQTRRERLTASDKYTITHVGRAERPEMAPVELIDFYITGSPAHQAQVLSNTAEHLANELEKAGIPSDEQARVMVLLLKSRAIIKGYDPEIQEPIDNKIRGTLGLFVKRNHPIIVKVVAPLMSPMSSLTYEDLTSEGQIGLINGLNNCDLHNENKLSGYWYIKMRGYVVDQIRATSHTIRPPRAVFNLMGELKKDPDFLSKGPEEEQARKKIEYEDIMLMTPRSLSKPFKQESGDLVDPLDIVGDEDANNGFKAIEETELSQTIMKAVEDLDPRLQKVVRMRFGFAPYEQEFTLAEIGRQIGVHESRVSQILSKIMPIIERVYLESIPGASQP